MRTLPTLGVCGWLVAAAALPALSALEWVAGGVAQAQQLSPPDRDALNLLLHPSLDLFQKELLFRGHESPVELNTSWVSSARDLLIDSARDEQLRRRLFFSVGKIGPSLGKGDHWKPAEFDRLIGR